MFIYLFFSVLIWQEKLSRTPGGKRWELGIGPSHLHFNEIISNWFIFTHALEILGYSLCPILKTLKSVVSGFGFNTYFLGCFFICHLHCKMIHLSHCDSEYSTLYLHFPVSPLETKPSAPGEWNLLTLGVLSRDESPQFSRLQPLSVPLALNGKAFPYCHLPFWGEAPEPSSCEGGSCYGSRSAWSLPCCRALLKHLCRDHSSWVTTSWTSNEMCRAKLSLEMLWLNFQ